MNSQLLKEPNTRGDGISTVRRIGGEEWPEIGASQVVSKIQCGYYCRPIWNLCRRTPLVARERRALLGARNAGVRVPLVLDYRRTPAGSELITTLISDALPLDQAVAQFPEQRKEILRLVGREIGKLHRARWTHGALYADHILVTPQAGFRVYLVDLEKGRRSLRAGRDLDRFLRHNSYLNAEDLVIFRSSYAAARRGAASNQDIVSR
jgi:tRNA A-37 threonylcarbamoyl transferase component Bud32